MSDRVLVDSSAWADYLRGRGRKATDVLQVLAEGRVWLHPIVVGEVLLGGVDLADGRLGPLPSMPERPTSEVLGWLRTRKPSLLRGVGWADCAIVHAAVTHGASLVTAHARQEALWRASHRSAAPPP